MQIVAGNDAAKNARTPPKVAVRHFIEDHPECTFDEIVAGIGTLPRTRIREATAAITNDGLLDAALRARGRYRLLNSPFRKPSGIAEEPKPVSEQIGDTKMEDHSGNGAKSLEELVEYVKRLNSAHFKLIREKARLQAEVERLNLRLSDMSEQIKFLSQKEVEELIVHKGIMEEGSG